MTYTSAETLLIIAAVGAVITNAISAWRVGTKVDSIAQKADIIGVKTAVIEGHVNSKETKYVEQINSKDNEIALLRAIIVTKDKDAALLAQSIISRNRSGDSSSSSKLESLTREIASNTAETAKSLKDSK